MTLPGKIKDGRRHLPYKRRTHRWKLSVAGFKFYLSADEYPDTGMPGAIWIDAAKQGAFTRHILHTVAQLTSQGLQYGVPLEKLVKHFVGQEFEPRGDVKEHPSIKEVASIIDLVFRVLGEEYLQGKEKPPQEKKP